MPTYNMVPKDKRSPRRPEVRRSNVVIYVLPLLLCLAAAVAIWCYTVGMNRPAEPETTLPVTDTAPSEESDAENGAEGDPAAPDAAPAESLPADSEAHPSDV